MRSQLFFNFLVVLSAFSCKTAQAQSLPEDGSFRKGKLANGLTYYIRHNDETKGVADYYIVQKVGSIQEEPRQRGLAHFLEHMAFNGTLHFPGNANGLGIVPWCEKVGIKFGANLNAYTSVDETVYHISDAPVTKSGVADSCLLILHDWSHFLLLQDEEIDKERGVVHEEWRSRRTGMAMQRLMEQAMPVLYAGSKYADAMPIGNMDVVDHFAYQDLRDYYQKWYRPDLQAIVVVGDIDVDSVEKQIKTLFSPIALSKNRAERVYYPVPDNDKMIIYSATDSEQPTVNFTLYMKHDATPFAERSTENYWLDDYKDKLIRIMLNARLDEISKKKDAPFVSSSVRTGNFFLAETKDALSLMAMLKQDQLKEGIEAAVAELERTRKTGFTEGELERAKSDLLSYAKSNFSERDKRRNSSYVHLCVENFLRSEPILTPETELNLTQKAAEKISLADINRYVYDLISDSNQAVTLYGPEKADSIIPSNDVLESWIVEAQKKDYEPYKEKNLDEPLMSALPKKGKIVKEEKSKFGYTKLLLSNGMRVYVRNTDFEADVVNLNMFSVGGTSLYADSDAVQFPFIVSGATAGGVGKFDDLTLDKKLAGKNVSVSPFVSDYTEGMKGYSGKADVETMLQLVNLYFTAPRYDKDAFSSIINKQLEVRKYRNASPAVVFRDSVSSICYDNNPRMAPLSIERIKMADYDRIMQIYRERFANAGDFDVILTGNIDMKALRPLICRYLASLPDNGTRDGIGKNGADIKKADETHVFVRQQGTPTSSTNIVYSVPMKYTAQNDLAVEAFRQILRTVYIEKVREDKGGTYGVSVGAELSYFPTSEAVMKISFKTDPAKYDVLIPIIYEQIKEIANNGPRKEDLDKVKEYLRKTYHQMLTMNGYWEYVKRSELLYGIDEDCTYKHDLEMLSADDIKRVAETFMKAPTRIEVTMKSK